jgi:23S rRNA (guanosine2251-2'-O)-methyltransferase
MRIHRALSTPKENFECLAHFRRFSDPTSRGGETRADTQRRLMLKGLMAKRKHSKASRGVTFSAPSGDRRRGNRISPTRQWWLYGTHAVGAALANPKRTCHRLIITSRSKEDMDAWAARARAAETERPRPEVWDRRELENLLPPGAVHQGVALLVDPLPEMAVEDVCEGAESGGPDQIVVLLDQATDPRNVGAVLRSAAAFGALAVIMQDRHAPDPTGVMAKAASGALETVPLVRAINLARTLGQLKEAGFWCIGLDGEADQTLAEAGLSGKVALVMGSEGDGLRRLTRETCDMILKVPIDSAVESLNLSNATAIALYEVVRGRA